MDYKEVTGAGKTWQRCYSLTILNLRNEIPRVRYEEQVVSIVGDVEVSRPVGSCESQFSAGKTFELRNPLTNELLGKTVTEADLHVMLYSHYMATAAARDAKAGA
jgi:hypothetical protein